MSSVHIYTAEMQPATRYVVDFGAPMKRQWFKHSPRSLVGTWCCRKKRWAGNCGVQVFYDSIRTWCLQGKGCKAK